MRKLPRTTWIAIGVIGILTMFASVMGNIGATALTWLSSQVALVLFVLISLVLIGISLWQERQKLVGEPATAEAHDYRGFMLRQVKKRWITGYLENPLYSSYDQRLIPLALRERIGSRFDLVLSNPLEPTQLLPSGTMITQAFDKAKGKLLIFGEPGAGKTTLLLELADNFHQRASDDKEAPIPVVLKLASWATKRLPLEQWIVEELQMKYEIPRFIGKEWVENDQLVLLLDDLDEVAFNVRPACIKAINSYYYQSLQSHVICSRTKEYRNQQIPLAVQAAVTIQPLSSSQIDSYLDGLITEKEEVEGLKQALHQSTTLRELATTPLFLTLLLWAYHGKPLRELLALVEANLADQRHLIFQDYVKRMLEQKGIRIGTNAQHTKHWLVWLASQMTAHNGQSELYLEQLQLDWLPKEQRAFHQWSVKLLVGLVFGLLGSPFGTIVGPFSILLGKPLASLLGGLLSGLSMIQFVEQMSTEIKPIEVLTWSPKKIVDWLPFGLGVGLLSGLISQLFFRLPNGWIVGLLGGLFTALDMGLFTGFSRKLPTENPILPNEGIRRSARNGLFTALLFGLLALSGVLLLGQFVIMPEAPHWELPSELSDTLYWGLLSGLFSALFGGLFFGWNATIQHYILRFWLWQAGCTPAPYRYIAFLDDTVDQLLLRKVGGGYVFRHRLLQDYFASLDVVSQECNCSNL